MFREDYEGGGPSFGEEAVAATALGDKGGSATSLKIPRSSWNVVDIADAFKCVIEWRLGPHCPDGMDTVWTRYEHTHCRTCCGPAGIQQSGQHLLLVTFCHHDSFPDHAQVKQPRSHQHRSDVSGNGLVGQVVIGLVDCLV